MKLNDQTKTLNCLLLRGSGPPLLGRQWLAEFGCWPLKMPAIAASSDNGNKLLNLKVNDVREKILIEFNVLFGSTPGLYNKWEIKLHVKEDTKPIAFGTRHVPYF